MPARTSTSAHTTDAQRRAPKLAVWKFASCDGCQLSLLNLEDELLTLAGAVDIAYFTEATSATKPGPYDLSLVEGSITTPDDAERIRRVRAMSKKLVTIGACAMSGGIQALRNFADVAEWTSLVYARPDYIATLAESTPVCAHVPVDFELHGCPVGREQLLRLITTFLSGRTPKNPTEGVCAECKRAGNVCVTVARGAACLGPVTQAGCGALCPTYDRGCFGCFGPARITNVPALAAHLRATGMNDRDVRRTFHTMNATAEPFRSGGDPHATDRARSGKARG